MQKRDYYGHQEDFQRIVRRVGSPDNEERLLKEIEVEVAHDHQLLLLKRCSQGILCTLCIPLLLYLFKVIAFPWMVAGLTGLLFILRQVMEALVEQCRKAHVAKYSDSLRRAKDRDAQLTKTIEEEWDTYCINYSGYPPDWKYRVLLVLDRDSHTCTECGWPNGVKRKVRQLHVHHVKSHSRGGNHALSNLVTLCDICHRKQEGPGHARINPRRHKTS